MTDADGPYLELMVGAYSDNQPDYSWMQPYETKVIRQYWCPIGHIGGIKNTTFKAAVNLETEGNEASFGFHTSYVDAHLLRGWGYLKDGKDRKALEDFRETLEYPANLEVAHPYHGGGDCQIDYFIAKAFEASSKTAKAKEFYQRSATTKQRAGWSELRFYQGMALLKLGQQERANKMFSGLTGHAEEQLASTGGLEFFAKFGRDRSKEERLANAHYLIGLGYLGKGRKDRAMVEFKKALKLNVNHLWARVYFSEINN